MFIYKSTKNLREYGGLTYIYIHLMKTGLKSAGGGEAGTEIPKGRRSCCGLP